MLANAGSKKSGRCFKIVEAPPSHWGLLSQFPALADFNRVVGVTEPPALAVPSTGPL